jgi:hypothetical protein
MVIPRSVRRWLNLPGSIALILGLGALPTAGAQADKAKDHEGGLGEALIRTEGEKIFLSEGGRETELPLTATPERDHLLRLLQDYGPAGVKLDLDPRLIMSGGGGSGFTWVPEKKDTDAPTPKAATSPPKDPTPPEKTEPPKKATAGNKG